MSTSPAVVVESKQRAAAVILAAGSGTRVGAEHNKVFLQLCGRRVVSWSIESLVQVRAVERIVMVIREQDRGIAEETIDREVEGVDVELVVGGTTRQQSELFALRHLKPAIAAGEVNLVLMHDGARPILAPTLVKTLLESAHHHDAAYPALEADDIRRVRPDGTIDMTNVQIMLRAQTPQAFRAQHLVDAYERAESEGFDGSDTVSCWDRYNSGRARWVPGDARNIKITYAEDLFAAAEILRKEQFRLG